MVVIGRSAASFSPMSESSSSSGTRPTCATHTLTFTSRSPIGTLTTTSRPVGPSAGRTGRRLKSYSG